MFRGIIHAVPCPSLEDATVDKAKVARRVSRVTASVLRVFQSSPMMQCPTQEIREFAKRKKSSRHGPADVRFCGVLDNSRRDKRWGPIDNREIGRCGLHFWFFFSCPHWVCRKSGTSPIEQKKSIIMNQMILFNPLPRFACSACRSSCSPAADVSRFSDVARTIAISSPLHSAHPFDVAFALALLRQDNVWKRGTAWSATRRGVRCMHRLWIYSGWQLQLVL